MSNAVLLELCFRPWIALPAGLCSVSIAFTELEIHTVAMQSITAPKLNPTHQVHSFYTALTQLTKWKFLELRSISLERFCWFNVLLESLYYAGLCLLFVAYFISGDKHSHLYRTVIIAESAIILQNNCIEWNWHITPLNDQCTQTVSPTTFLPLTSCRWEKKYQTLCHSLYNRKQHGPSNEATRLCTCFSPFGLLYSILCTVKIFSVPISVIWLTRPVMS